MASLENSDQRFKVIDRGDLAKFLREDMIDQLRGEEMTLSTLSGENFYTPRNSLLEVCREYIERDPQTDALLIQYPMGSFLNNLRGDFSIEAKSRFIHGLNHRSRENFDSSTALKTKSCIVSLQICGYSSSAALLISFNPCRNGNVAMFSMNSWVSIMVWRPIGWT